jgi:hypothetical protein
MITLNLTQGWIGIIDLLSPPAVACAPPAYAMGRYFKLIA